MNDCIELIKKTINNNFEHKKFDWTEIKQDVRNDLEKFLYKKTNRRPVVLPVVMEVNQNRHRAMQKRSGKNATTGKNNEHHSVDVKKSGKKIVKKD